MLNEEQTEVINTEIDTEIKDAHTFLTCRAHFTLSVTYLVIPAHLYLLTH